VEQDSRRREFVENNKLPIDELSSKQVFGGSEENDEDHEGEGNEEAN
jgi:hypothetical protein